MKYIVKKTFKNSGKFYVSGDIVEFDDELAAKLRAYGLIAGSVREAPKKKKIQRAVKKPAEKAVKE